MNWEVIGAVSTVLGVIGGLVRVVSLILEVRRNAQAIEGATVQSLMNFEQALIDPEVWEAYLRAMQEKLGKPGFLASWRDVQASQPVSFQTMAKPG